MVSVAEYLLEAGKRRWRWGGGKDGFEGDDCTLFVANWALALTGTDPGIGLRGSYDTDHEAMAIVERAGGFPAFIDQQLRPQGWSRIAGEPRDGDIAVVLAPLPPAGEFGPVPAIRAEGLWIGRSMRGQVARGFRAISIWRWNAAPAMDLGPPAQKFCGMLPTPQQMYGGTALTPIPSQMQQTGILEGFIVAGLTAAGVSAGATAFIAPLLAGVAATGISLAVNSLFAPDVPKPPEPEEGRVPILQALPPVIYAVGRNRISGYAMLHEAKSDELFMVNGLVGHRIEGVVGVYLHEDNITIDPSPNEFWPSMMSAENGDDDRYGPRVAIDWRLGDDPNTAYEDFVTALSGEGVYTSSYRGDGVASIAIACKAPTVENFQKEFPYGVPQPSVVLDCARVWDWRDEAQDPEDPDTWEYSTNAVLLMIWHYCFNPYYGIYDYEEAVLPNIARLTEEADICDEPVALAAGGSEPRYEANIWTTTDKDPKGFANAILNAGDIWFSHRGDGTLEIVAGKFREDLVETITDDDIAGYFMQNDVEEENEVNQLIPKFVYPATDYTSTDADAFNDLDSQLIFGIQRGDCDLQAVQSWRQARRLAKREWLRLQMKRRGSLDLHLSGINAAYARWVRIESTRFPRLNGLLIENRRSVVSFMDGAFAMEFIEHPEDIDAWEPEDDEGSAPPVPNGAASGELETATIDSVAALSGPGGVFLRIAIVQPITDSLTPLARYRLATGPGQWIEQSFPDAQPDSGLIILDTNPVIGGEDYEIQVAFQATRRTKSAWEPEPPYEINATIDTTVPDPVTDLEVSVSNGTATLTFTAPNSFSTALRSYRVYRWPSSGSYPGDAIDVSGTRAVAPNSEVSFVDQIVLPASGTYIWGVVTENYSSVQSSVVESDPYAAGYDADALAYINALSSKPNAAWRQKYSTLAEDLKAAGLWSKLKVLALLKNVHEEAALLDFRVPTRVFTNHSATFTSNAHMAGNGSSAWIDIGVTPAAAGASLDSITLGANVVGGTDAAVNAAVPIGVTNTTNLRISPRGVGDVINARINTAGTNQSLGAITTAYGRTVVTRRGSTDTEAYRNGVSNGTSAVASSSLPSNNLCLLRSDATYVDFQITDAFVLEGITDAEVADLEAALAAYVA